MKTLENVKSEKFGKEPLLSQAQMSSVMGGAVTKTNDHKTKETANDPDSGTENFDCGGKVGDPDLGFTP